MHTAAVAGNLGLIFRELVHGAPLEAAYILNRGDPGLLRALDRISAARASGRGGAGSSVAAHVDHLRYGLSLLNQWAAGIRPMEDADWTASWRRVSVSEAEWAELRRTLADECDRWLTVLETPRDVGTLEMNDMLGSIAHLAYHLGAIRQIAGELRGPAATDPLVSTP